jgi:hypothetical protein
MKTNFPDGWDYTTIFGLPPTATNWQLQIMLGLLGLFLAFIMYRRHWHRV